MKRRSFLGAMLASFTAPYAMSSGLSRGILMPGRAIKEYAVEGYEIIDGGVLMPANFVGPMLRLFTAAGLILAEIPLTKQQQALFDYGRSVSMDFSGAGEVIATGMAARYEVDLSEGVRHKGDVGHGLRLDNTALVVGQNVTIPSMLITGPESFCKLVDADGEPM